MKIFKIEIQETLSRVVVIEAESADDAVLKVNNQYKNSEIILNFNDFVSVDFVDVDC